VDEDLVEKVGGGKSSSTVASKRDSCLEVFATSVDHTLVWLFPKPHIRAKEGADAGSLEKEMARRGAQRLEVGPLFTSSETKVLEMRPGNEGFGGLFSKQPH
jgi:hypothetical protein